MKDIKAKQLNRCVESEDYLSEQIITYIGNKRALLDFIGKGIKYIKRDLKKDKLDIVDIFAGSGVVSRYFKQYAHKLYSNDLETYSYIINSCYLTNKSDIDFEKLNHYYYILNNELNTKPLKESFVTKLYSPKNDNDIKEGERVFYTSRNAKYIDTARNIIESFEEPYKTFFLASLLYEASIHNNTSGVFKGFYKNSMTGIGQFGGDGKNALKRILGEIDIKMPIFSNFECNVNIYQEDANKLAKILPEVDICYIDPPYNQHPYGSNYFMLNLIANNKEPNSISEVSGIPTDWNKSDYNKKALIKERLFDLCNDIKSKYLLISFNSDGFIKRKEMTKMLSTIGKVKVYKQDYNTFRGSRNLNNRDIHVTEFLYLVKKF